jgi:hypothetical protein
MTKIDLSEVAKAVENMYVAPEERVLDPTKMAQSLIDRMPEPTGWRMLILPYRGKGKTAGGLFLPDKVVEEGNISTVVGYVATIGDPEDILSL